MKVNRSVQPHREKIIDITDPSRVAEHLPAISAAVAKVLSRKEWLNDEKALKSVYKEKEKLQARGTWDETTVCEYDDIVKLSRRDGKKRHMGRVHAICCLKNS